MAKIRRILAHYLELFSWVMSKLAAALDEEEASRTAEVEYDKWVLKTKPQEEGE